MRRKIFCYKSLLNVYYSEAVGRRQGMVADVRSGSLPN